MKRLFIFLMCCSFKITAQEQKIDFCQMLKADQSNYCLGIEFASDSCIAQRARRYKIFEDNFKVLLQITRKAGFPNAKNHPLDSCVYDLTIATIVHIAQSKPELMFNNSIITLFEEEIKKENLNKLILFTMFIGYAKYSNPKEKDRPMVELAIVKWKLESEIKQHIEMKYYPEP